MTRQRIARLRARYALSESLARLIAQLANGGDQ